MKRSLFISLICLLFISCEPTPSRKAENFILTEEQKVMVQNSNEFSLELFRKACEYEKQERNVFISPLSASIALGMAATGADGATLSEMKEVLGFEDYTLEDMDEFYKTLLHSITQLDMTTQFEIANAIWVRKNFPLLADYQNTCETYFSSTVENLDFDDATYCATYVNNWCNLHTHGLIPKVVDASTFTPELAVLIANAIYFKGKWAKKFDKKNTTDKPFYNYSGTSSSVPMMSLSEEFKAAYLEEASVLEMDYKGGSYCMNIILPHEGRDINQIIKDMDITQLNEYLKSGYKSKIYIEVPKFDMRYDIEMNDILIDMGMKSAFCGADFSAMTPESVSISHVNQSAYLSIDEEGTKAAAVTTISFTKTASMISTFIVNRPFILIIREKVQNNIVFIGKIEKL